MKQPLTGSRKQVFETLSQSDEPLSAYDILARLASEGVSGPPTIYRALEKLQGLGLVHRIESLNAYKVCERHHDHGHAAQFAICRNCGTVTEIENKHLHEAIQEWAEKSGFFIESETVEVHGLCGTCSKKAKS
ncbi:MAG: Fur family transcriptional regulator [Rickettsiales bacterium]